MKLLSGQNAALFVIVPALVTVIIIGLFSVDKDDPKRESIEFNIPYPVNNFSKIDDLMPLASYCDEKNEVGNIVYNRNGRPFYCIFNSSKPEWQTPNLSSLNI